LVEEGTGGFHYAEEAVLAAEVAGIRLQAGVKVARQVQEAA